MSKNNPLLEAYISETQKEQDVIIGDWARVLRKHYDAFLKEGFTANQSMRLLEVLWRQVDERQMRKEKP